MHAFRNLRVAYVFINMFLQIAYCLLYKPYRHLVQPSLYALIIAHHTLKVLFLLAQICPKRPYLPPSRIMSAEDLLMDVSADGKGTALCLMLYFAI